MNHLKNLLASVAGHTDTVGNNDYNKTLSDKRADAVGIQPVEMNVSGKIEKKDRYGETSPAVATGDNKNERKNRRVSIRVSDQRGVSLSAAASIETGF